MMENNLRNSSISYACWSNTYELLWLGVQTTPQEQLDKMLASGEITQEEYDSFKTSKHCFK
jgi:hypothetical protein